jgi:predicted amidohydrolase
VTLTVALLQMVAGSDASELLRRVETFCRPVQDMGADLALFPETWNALCVLPHPPEDLWQAPEVWSPTALGAPPVPDPAAYQRWLGQAVSQSDPYVTYAAAHFPGDRPAICARERLGRAV